MNQIYFDNSATTALSDAARRKMNEAMDLFGNPSSLHAAGVAANRLLNEARESLLSSLGVRPSEGASLVFTSCGSEATNLALFGTTHAKSRRIATRIVTTDSEHPSVESCMQRLETEGFEIVRVPTRNGIPDEATLDRVLDKNVFLVSVMMVNNETGAKYDVGKIFRLAKARNPDVITHTDAVQGFLKCKFTPSQISADLVTLSGHKIHAPKGVGALYINKRLITRRAIVPWLLGGGQESGLRSGTENMIGICGFGAAARDGAEHLTENLAKLSELSGYCKDRLSLIGEIRLNCPAGERAPHILNLTLPGIRSETMLHYLSREGICVSAGSACSSHDSHPSASLLAFGLSPKEAECSIRVSFCESNTKEEIDRFIAVLTEGLRTLVRVKK